MKGDKRGAAVSRTEVEQRAKEALAGGQNGEEGMRFLQSAMMDHMPTTGSGR